MNFLNNIGSNIGSYASYAFGWAGASMGTGDDEDTGMEHVASALMNPLKKKATEWIVGSEEWRASIKKNLLNGIDLDEWIAADKGKIATILDDPKTLFLFNEKLTPQFTNILCNDLAASSPELKEFYLNEKEFIAKVTQAILMRILRHAVEHDDRAVKDTKSQDPFADVSKDPVVRILARLGALVIPHFEKIDQKKFNEGYHHPNSDYKALVMQELFHPLSIELMKVLMPGGKDDIPLPGKPLIGQTEQNISSWESILKSAVPHILKEVYHYAQGDAYQTEGDKKILERQGGDFMKALAKKIANKAVRGEAKELMHKHCDKVGAAIAEKIEVKEVKEWVSNFIKALADAKGNEFDAFFGYAEHHVESIALHVIASLAKESNGNIIPAVAEKAVGIIYDYFIKKENFETLKYQIQNPALTDAQREALFKPLAERLIVETGLEKVVAVKMLQESALPQLIFECFRDMAAFDDDVAPNKVKLAALLLVEKTTATDEEKTQAKKTVEEMSKVLGVFSNDIEKVVEAYVHNPDENFARLVNKHVLDGQLDGNEKGIHEFAVGVVSLFDSLNPAVLDSKDYISNKIYEALFKIFTLVAEKTAVDGTAEEGKNLKTLLPAQVSAQAMKVLIKHLPTIVPAFDQIQKGRATGPLSKEDTLIQEKKLNNLFAPVAAEFIAFLGTDADFAKGLPLPTLLQEPIAKIIKESILPSLFSNIYSDVTPWYYQTKENEEGLKKIFPEGNVNHSVGVIGKHIQALIPHYMEQHADKIAMIIKDKIANKYFKAMDPASQKVAESLLIRNIKALEKEEGVKEGWKGAALYAEGFVNKLFLGMAANVSGNEEGLKTFINNGQNFESKLLLELLTEVLGQGSEHFEKIRKLSSSGKISSDLSNPKSILPIFKEFRAAGLLHEAVAQDFNPGMTEKGKEGVRLEKFYKPLAKKLLKLANMEECPNDFPAPKEIRGEMWKVFSQEVLPEVLLNVFKEVLNPINIKQALLKGVKLLGTVERVIEKATPEEIAAAKDAVEKEDPHQKAIDKHVGDLLLTFVQLAPSYLDNFPMVDIKKMKEIGGPALGRIVRQKLGDKTVMGMVDSLLAGFEIDAPGKKKPVNEAALDRELKSECGNYISDQVKTFVKDYIHTKWETFQKKFDEAIVKAFGKGKFGQFMVKVKKFLDKIFRAIFIDFLGPVWNFLIYTIGWFFVRHHINYKMGEYVKGIGMPVNENLVLKSTETFIDRLLNSSIPKKKEKEALRAEKGDKAEEAKEEAEKEEELKQQRLKDKLLKERTKKDQEEVDKKHFDTRLHAKSI